MDLFLLALLLIPVANALPPNFVEQIVATVPRNNLDLVFLPPTPDGTTAPLLVVENLGRVLKVENFEGNSPSPTVSVVLDIQDDICSNGSFGLMSVEPHPDFYNGKPWMYAFQTVKGSDECNYPSPNGPYNQIVRYTVNPDTLEFDVGSKIVFLKTMHQNGQTHVGGDLKVGREGDVWATIGDLGHNNNSQDPRFLNGCVIRLKEDGSVPPENPYQVSKGVNAVSCKATGEAQPGEYCEECWATGLRNPFRFSMDPKVTDKTRIFTGDVGGSAFEEINELGTDFPGVDYGWRSAEGPCLKWGSQSCVETDVKQVIPNHGRPVFWYKRGLDQDAAVTGIAFVPPGVWPAEYEDTILFADYTQGTISHVVFDHSLECDTCDPPTAPGTRTIFHEHIRVTAMEFGPYTGLSPDGQAFYFVARTTRDNLRRIVYTGTVNSNTPPVAILLSDITGVVRTGETIIFDASSSFDVDQHPLQFSFDFGDGNAVGPSSTSIVTHSYATKGTYTVTLTVEDGQTLGVDVETMDVAVGSPPTLTLTGFNTTTPFSVGDVYFLEVDAIDGSGNPIPSNMVTWEGRQHHLSHFHPWQLPRTGNGFDSYPAFFPEDLEAATNSRIEFLATAEDGDGLTTTESYFVFPYNVSAFFYVNPPELSASLRFAGFPIPEVNTGNEVVMWPKWTDFLEALDVPGWDFVSWSDGGAQRHSITVPAYDPLVSPTWIATYAPTANEISIASIELQLEDGTLFAPITDGAVIVDPPRRLHGAVTVQGGTGVVERVHFVLTGTKSVNRNDLEAPFTVFPNFIIWPKGPYTLTVEAQDADGTWSNPMTVSFLLVEDAPQPTPKPTPQPTPTIGISIASIELQLEDGTLFAPITDGAVIVDPPRRLHGAVTVQGGTGVVERVHFVLTGTKSVNRNDLEAPFTVFPNFIIWPKGPYTLTVKAKDADGTWSNPVTVSFLLVEDAPTPVPGARQLRG